MTEPKNIKPGESDCPLMATIEGENLVIRIGVGRLAWCAKNDGQPVLAYGQRISSPAQWAEDVAKALMRDDDAGNSLINQCITDAMEKARDNGSTGIMERKPHDRLLQPGRCNA